MLCTWTDSLRGQHRCFWRRRRFYGMPSAREVLSKWGGAGKRSRWGWASANTVWWEGRWPFGVRGVSIQVVRKTRLAQDALRLAGWAMALGFIWKASESRGVTWSHPGSEKMACWGVTWHILLRGHLLSPCRGLHELSKASLPSL